MTQDIDVNKCPECGGGPMVYTGEEEVQYKKDGAPCVLYVSTCQSCGMRAVGPNKRRHPVNPAISSPTLQQTIERLLEWALQANARLPYEISEGMQFGGNQYLNPPLRQAIDVLARLHKEQQP